MRTDQFAVHADLEDEHWWFVARRHIITSVVRQAVPPRAGCLIVDVGCGTGANIAALAADYCCLGVDTSAEAVAAASGRFPDLQFVRGDVPADVIVPLSKASLVLLTDVLEHVEDDIGFLGRIVDALGRANRVLITVPAGPHLWTEHDRSFGHHRRYTFETLETLWTRLPVRVLLLTAFNARLYPPILLIRRVHASRGGVFGRAGTDFEMPPAWLNRLLTWIMQGETRRIQRSWGATGRPAYRRGVSLLALIEKTHAQ